jgi:predicted transcriptional regulator
MPRNDLTNNANTSHAYAGRLQDPPPPYFIDSRTFAATEYPRVWLIEGMLLQGQVAVLAGGKKSLKTALVIELAVSLGTGLPLLGAFPVPAARRVAVLSGESGEPTLKETAIRICHAKGTSLEEADIHWRFKLPAFTDENEVNELVDELVAEGCDVVFVDPLYLCLLNGDTSVSATNLFQVGPLLQRFTRKCLDDGITPVLVHHTRKGKNRADLTPPDLDDMAYAGISEFARQWLLVKRVREYVPGSGEHLIMLSVGGSAGHSACLLLQIQEGVMNSDFTGRTWNVEILREEDLEKGRTLARRQTRQQRADERRNENLDKLLEALEARPEGETQTKLAEAAGLEKKVVKDLLEELASEGRVEATQVMKQCGPAVRPISGWRLSAGEARPQADADEPALADARVVIDDDEATSLPTERNRAQVPAEEGFVEQEEAVATDDSEGQALTDNAHQVRRRPDNRENLRYAYDNQEDDDQGPDDDDDDEEPPHYLYPRPERRY